MSYFSLSYLCDTDLQCFIKITEHHVDAFMIMTVIMIMRPKFSLLIFPICKYLQIIELMYWGQSVWFPLKLQFHFNREAPHKEDPSWFGHCPNSASTPTPLCSFRHFVEHIFSQKIWQLSNFSFDFGYLYFDNDCMVIVGHRLMQWWRWWWWYVLMVLLVVNWVRAD